MPAALTHKSILLLAHRRLARLVEVLDARVSPGRPATEIERRVHRLARLTTSMLGAQPTIDATTDLPAAPPGEAPLGRGISKFAVMGSMGPDIPDFGALLAPGQGWIFDAIHKGTPDSDRESVHVGSTDFPLALWRHGSAAVAGDAGLGDTQKAEALDALRAYVLGHLCHVAGDSLSHPFINDIEWHLSLGSRQKFSHAGGEGALDAQVARQVLGRDSTREGQGWDRWWPTLDEVDQKARYLFDAYHVALVDIYPGRLRADAGLAEFRKSFDGIDPPEASPELIRDAYGRFRGGVISMGYGYGWGSWFFFLAPLFLSLLAVPPITLAMPKARQFTRPSQPEDEAEYGLSELMAVSMAVMAPAAFGYAIWLTVEHATGVGEAMGVATFTAGAGFLIGLPAILTAATSTEQHGLVRWLVFVGIPAVLGLIQLIAFFRDLARDHHGFHSLVHFFPMLPVAAAIIVVLLTLLLLVLPRSRDVDADGMTALTGILIGLWSLVMLVLWIWLPFKARDARIPEDPEPFPAQQPHTVRLFDEGTLHLEPGADPSDLTRRVFPSGRRELLRLWWEGTGDLFIRSDRVQLVFARDEAGTSPQVVRAPIEPMNLVDYIGLLGRVVLDTNGDPGKLRAERAFNLDAEDYDLPPGATFAAHGDELGDLEKRQAEAAKFRKLGRTEDDAYILFHAPKSEQSVRFGRLTPAAGVADDPNRPADLGDPNGFFYVHDPTGPRTTIMDLAGDFAALLCLGAASHLATPADRVVPGLPDGTALDEVYQVFRNWSLDRRRVNEWKMLVAGGARSEKAGQPDRFDPAMTRPPAPAAYRSRVPEGEAVARRLGWVPLLRQWIDVIERPGADPLADTPSFLGGSTPRELSQGLAFLLDLPASAVTTPNP